VILDTPDITPLGHLLRQLKTPDEVSAILVLRNVQDSTVCSVTIEEITEIDHERERGAIWFGAILTDGRRIEAYVFATPKAEDSDVYGRATIKN
jgi:hypothetical protein